LFRNSENFKNIKDEVFDKLQHEANVIKNQKIKFVDDKLQQENKLEELKRQHEERLKFKKEQTVINNNQNQLNNQQFNQPNNQFNQQFNQPNNQQRIPNYNQQNRYNVNNNINNNNNINVPFDDGKPHTHFEGGNALEINFEKGKFADISKVINLKFEKDPPIITKIVLKNLKTREDIENLHFVLVEKFVLNTVTELECMSCFIKGDLITTFCQAIENMPSLISLNLSNNNIDDTAVELLTVLKTKQSLVRINLARNKFSEEFLTEIFTSFTDPNKEVIFQ